MAVNYHPPEQVAAVAGVNLAAVSAQIKYPDRLDLVVLELSEGTQTAAVFTQNQFCAAPVQVAKQHLAQIMPRYLVINTGYANAGTGERGMTAARETCAVVAEHFAVQPEQVLPFSTGVIGEHLPVDRITAGLPSAKQALKGDAWRDVATGIMTTDTLPKCASRQFELDGHTVTISGVSKGAGMIKPNMATMLGFVCTDATVDAERLQQLLKAGADQSFNSITVDSDTSTNDALTLSATGASAVVVDDHNEAAFAEQLNGLLLELAQAIVRDAEGATKFVEVRVTEAGNVDEARQVAYTIGHSPLVKTALFASDPNWGRILAAVGRAGLDNLAVDGVRLWLDDVLIAEQGAVAESYQEAQGQAVMDQSEIVITVALGRGSAETRLWTSDFSHEYVTINAEYRT